MVRPRVLRLLDRGRRRRVVWVVGPPGAGKTTLVASWLRSRRLRHLWVQLDEGDADVATLLHFLASAGSLAGVVKGLPVVTPQALSAPAELGRRFFRALGGIPRAPAVIVLDDYHELPAASASHDALAAGFRELPDGMTVVVTSREVPPPSLARARAAGQLELIGPDALAFTVAEVAALQRMGRGRQSPGLAAALHARTEGWAAGLAVLVGGAGPPFVAGPRLTEDDSLSDYFSQEVLARTDAETRRFLVECALLPDVTAEAAAALTGATGAGELLARLSRGGWFLSRRGEAFRFHSLFRDFLLAESARTLSPARLDSLRRSAAALARGEGEVEAAFRLHAAARDWAGASRLLREEAQALMLQGRSATLARWGAELPAVQLERDPWLRLAWGEALAVAAPERALPELEGAYDRFWKRADGRGVRLAWSAIVSTHLHAVDVLSPLDRWISELERLRRRFREPSDPTTEARLIGAAFAALAHRQPWHPSLAEWEAQALRLALSPGPDHVRMQIGWGLLLFYAAWGIDLARARLVSEALAPLAAGEAVDPATAIGWAFAESMRFAQLARSEECFAAVERGLAIAEESGHHAWDALLQHSRLLAALQDDDLAAAERVVRSLATASQRAGGFSPVVFHHGSTLLALRRGDTALAAEHARACGALSRQAGGPLIELPYALTCVRAGPEEGMDAALGGIAREAARCGSWGVVAGSRLLLALRALDRGEEEPALAPLREGLAALRTLGGRHVFWLDRREMSRLCGLAIERGIEPELAILLVRAQRLLPDARARSLAAWPWEVRIRALGEFTVEVAGEPLRWGRKEQRRPLAVLRMLVAGGPKGLRQDLLAEALWPGADGDAGQHALETALYRLRRLLGSNASILQRGGRLALAPDRVFVDAWAVESLLERAGAPAPGAALPDETRRRVRELYRGDLFGEEPDEGLMIDARRRLRSRVQGLLE